MAEPLAVVFPVCGRCHKPIRGVVLHVNCRHTGSGFLVCKPFHPTPEACDAE